MITVQIGEFRVEVKGGVRRVTVVYGSKPEPQYLNVVGDDHEAWSLGQNGIEFGTRIKGVRVLTSSGTVKPVDQLR